MYGTRVSTVIAILNIINLLGQSNIIIITLPVSGAHERPKGAKEHPSTHMLAILSVVVEFGRLIMSGSGELIIQVKTVASGVNSPVQGFSFRITPTLSGIRQIEQQFAFPDYTSGDFVSITVAKLKPGLNYTFSATAVNVFGISEAATSPGMQIVPGTSGKCMCNN